MSEPIVDEGQPINSFATTLRERGRRTGTGTASGTIPIGSSLNFTVSVPMPDSTVDSLKRIKITGTGVANIDNYWYLHDGYTRPNSPSGATTYLIFVTNYNDGSNENFLFEFRNNTGGSPVVLPTITLTAVCRFYDAPWEDV